MLEPHPPHAALHTWKDFFIHIATIVIGLLIAVGLEQSVEAIHRHNERRRVLIGLQEDTEKTVRDCARMEEYLGVMIGWVRQHEQVLSDAKRDGKPPGAQQRFPPGSLDMPAEPVYRLAKASGKLDLLTDEDAAAYGEVDLVYANLLKAYDQWNEATQQSIVNRQTLKYGAAPGDPPFAHTTPAQRFVIYKGYLAQERGMIELRLWFRQLHDAAAAVARGERDVRKIQSEEHKRQDLP
jgi:hypothetical protein